MNKKGQDLPVTVIIIAVLALLVLVILALIFTGKMGSTVQRVDQCQGSCVAPEACTGQYQRATRDLCYDGSGKVRDDVVCCVGV